MSEWENDDRYLISTDRSKIDFQVLHHYLSKESYWSKNIPSDILKTGIENSICFSVLSPSKDFIGFARVITDMATFGYLADVFVLDDYKGKGLGKWLVSTIMSYKPFKWLRNWFLYTKDAHSLYEKFGWERLESLDRAMVKRASAQHLYEEYTSTLHQDQ